MLRLAIACLRGLQSGDTDRLADVLRVLAGGRHGSIGTLPLTVQTDGVAPNSGDATKTFVDANIGISPSTGTNPAGTNHTLTGHVNVNDGLGAGFVNAPNGTVINFSLTNAGGATATFVGQSSCVTAGGTGSCSVVINSPTAGTTTIRASTNVVVGGVVLTRATGDSNTGDSLDASKVWQQSPQTITFTSTPPNPALVGGSYTPTATGGGSGNPVVFSIDSSSAAGACSLVGGVVMLTGPGVVCAGREPGG